YVYAAKRCAADLAALFGQTERAAELVRQAEALQKKFEEAFWCEDLSTYALALDGQKHRCRVRSSNAGHCLLTGIAAPDRARRFVQPRGRPANRHSRAGPRPPRGQNAARTRILFRVGHPDDPDERDPLQPDVVPQRFDLAA